MSKWTPTLKAKEHREEILVMVLNAE